MMILPITFPSTKNWISFIVCPIKMLTIAISSPFLNPDFTDSFICEMKIGLFKMPRTTEKNILFSYVMVLAFLFHFLYLLSFYKDKM